MVEGPGGNLAPIYFSHRQNSKEKFLKETPPYALIMENLENYWPPQWIRLVVTQVGKLWRGSSNLEHQNVWSRILFDGWARAVNCSISTTWVVFQRWFCYMAMWGGGPDGCCIPISMSKVWRALGRRQHIVEQMSSLRHEADMIREI